MSPLQYYYYYFCMFVCSRKEPTTREFPKHVIPYNIYNFMCSLLSLSTIGVQRPSYELSCSFQLCPSLQAKASPPSQFLSAGRAAAHPVFNLMNFTSLIASEIIQTSQSCDLPWTYSNKPITSSCRTKGLLTFLSLQSPPPTTPDCPLFSANSDMALHRM